MLRRVEEELGDQFTVIWSLIGSQRYTTRQGRTSRNEGRALIGFIDGTSNLDPRHNPDDAKLTFVDPDAVPSYPHLPQPQNDPYTQTAQLPGDLRQPPTSEPEWTRHGTYLAVRASLQNTTNWDDQTLDTQEHVIGRFKFSGASLDLSDDPQRLGEAPAFAADPSSVVVPVTAHVRKANPRRPDDSARRIFRRGYPIVAPDANGGLTRGLLFECFGRTISTQFEFVFCAWMRTRTSRRPVPAATGSSTSTRPCSPAATTSYRPSATATSPGRGYSRDRGGRTHYHRLSPRLASSAHKRIPYAAGPLVGAATADNVERFDDQERRRLLLQAERLDLEKQQIKDRRFDSGSGTRTVTCGPDSLSASGTQLRDVLNPGGALRFRTPTMVLR